VIHADGGIGGYTGGLANKRFLLRLEGVSPSG
jgi:O6-methylguanine-DNA--protein-cysteine methyltransferase